MEWQNILTSNSLSKPSSLLRCISLTWAGNNFLDTVLGSRTSASAFPSSVVQRYKSCRQSFMSLNTKMEENLKYGVQMMRFVKVHICTLILCSDVFVSTQCAWQPGVGSICRFTLSFMWGSTTSAMAIGSFTAGLSKVHGHG